LTLEARQTVIEADNESLFPDLALNHNVAMLEADVNDVGSESTIYRILRQEDLLNHLGGSPQPREVRPTPVLTETGINQVPSWDDIHKPCSVMDNSIASTR
jgi:hypothetical protein